MEEFRGWVDLFCLFVHGLHLWVQVFVIPTVGVLAMCLHSLFYTGESYLKGRGGLNGGAMS